MPAPWASTPATPPPGPNCSPCGRHRPAAPAVVAACVFDASDLLDYVQRDRAPTGIQRVQLNLIEHSLRSGPRGTAVAAFDPAQRRLEADPARRVRAPGRPGAERRRPGRAGMEGRGWRGAGCRAARAGARIRARRRPGHPRHRLVDPELPAARARSEGTVRPSLRAVHPRLHPRPGAGTLRRRPGHRIRRLVRRCLRPRGRDAGELRLHARRRAAPAAALASGRRGPPRHGAAAARRAIAARFERRRRVRARGRRTAGPMCSSSPPSRAARTTCWCSTPGFP